jgi:ABC-type nitrate/sulfonate/bicarbonate transport system, ATPase component
MDEPAFLKLNGIRKSYANQQVLDGLTFTVNKGEFIAIIGKSGCGKSTLLRLIAGLEKASGGMLLQNGKPLQGINRSARMMFQNGRLLPWEKVIDNVGIGLGGEWKTAAAKALSHVGLAGYADNYPARLSGGQKQRVALARALVHQPQLLLLDEPLSALDALTRLEMQILIESVWKRTGLTSILVTHDVEEAVRLADRVILLENGCVHDVFKIDLPRPRKKSDFRFGVYTEAILGKIMGKKQTSVPIRLMQ